MKLSRGSPYLIAVGCAAAYGLFVRRLAHFPHASIATGPDVPVGTSLVFGVMTLSFLVLVPACMGFFTVRVVREPSAWLAVFGGSCASPRRSTSPPVRGPARSWRASRARSCTC